LEYYVINCVLPPTSNRVRRLNLPQTSKAAICKNYGGPLEIVNVPIPVPKTGEVLVKIHASGCCHTDVHAVDGDWPVKPKASLCPGHEGAGVVVDVGEDVTEVQIGDRVGIPWLHTACGSCEFCTSGWETLCLKQQNTGYSVDGCFQEYAIGRASHVVKISESLDFVSAAPILCAGVTAYKALKEADCQAGDFVTIIGAAGGLGHLACQYALAMGFQPIAVDIGAEKLAYCKSLGVKHAVDPKAEDAVAAINKITDGGSHGVICFAASQAAFQQAVNFSRSKGTIVCVGLPAGSFDCPIFDVVLKRLTIRGSIVGTRKDMQEAMSFAERGLVKCNIRIESLSNVNIVLDDLRQGKIEGRVVLKMD